MGSAVRFVLRRVRKAVLHCYSRCYALLAGVRLGRGSVIHPGARVRITRGGSIAIGTNCELLRGCIVETYGGNIRLGDNVSVNYYSILYGHGGLDVGNDVRIAAHAVLIPANHGIEAAELIRRQPLSRVGIVVQDDVWIGTGARVLDGVRIPTGCVIAAGAVVVPATPLEARGIYGGVPARRISTRH